MNNLDHYRQDIRGIVKIDKDKIIGLLKKARAGNRNARDIIIRSYLKLVWAMSKYYHGKHLTQLDIISHGNLGLFDAIDKFDFSRGTSFTTFAAVRIRKNICKCLRDEDNTIRIPYGVHDLMSKHERSLKKEIEGKKDSNKINDNQKMLVGYAKLAKQTCSINCRAGEEDTDELVTLLPGSFTNVRRIDFNILRDELSSRERKVIDLRLRNISLEGISIKMQVSRERIRQIEAGAIRKMAKAAGKVGLFAVNKGSN